MFYSTMLEAGKKKAIGVAVSDDGFRWDKRGVCLRPDEEEGSLDGGGCARSTVVRNAVFANGVWEESEGWTMFYEGVSTVDGKHRIMMAQSTDGMNWTKESEGWTMFYEGVSTVDGKHRIMMT